MNTGQEFVKQIRPFGAALFLLLFVLFLIICFTSGSNPLSGYEPPHDSSYYAQNDETLAELKTELETNVFPRLDGIEDSRVSGEKLEVTVAAADYAKDRSAILRYYDESLFEFIISDT